MNVSGVVIYRGHSDSAVPVNGVTHTASQSRTSMAVLTRVHIASL